MERLFQRRSRGLSYHQSEKQAFGHKSIIRLEFWLMGPNPIAFEDYEKALARINSYLGYLQHFDEYKAIDRTLRDSSLNNLFIFTPNYSKAAFQPEVKHALKQYSHDNFVHAWN